MSRERNESAPPFRIRDRVFPGVQMHQRQERMRSRHPQQLEPDHPERNGPERAVFRIGGSVIKSGQASPPPEPALEVGNHRDELLDPEDLEKGGEDGGVKVEQGHALVRSSSNGVLVGKQE